MVFWLEGNFLFGLMKRTLYGVNSIINNFLAAFLTAINF